MRKSKKVIAIVSAMAIVATSGIGYECGKVRIASIFDKGANVTCSSNTKNLINKDQGSLLCNKLEYDRENNTTKLPATIERKLNEAGVFDSDITTYSEKDIERLNKAKNIFVDVNYYTYDENGKKEKASDEQIENAISENIENGNLKYEKKDTSLFGKAIACLGLAPIKASAKMSYYASDTSNTGMMKETVVGVQESAGKVVSIVYTAKWIIDPACRYKDALGFAFKDTKMHLKPGSSSASVSYKDEAHQKKTKKLQTREDLSGVSTVINLKNKDYATVTMSFKIVPENNKMMSLVYKTSYKHTKKSYSIGLDNISVSYPAGVCISIGKDVKASEMTSSLYGVMDLPGK